MTKYETETGNFDFTQETDDASLDVIVDLPPGFYPSIHVYAGLSTVRGGMHCSIRDRVTQKYKSFLPLKFQKSTSNWLSWDLQNINLTATMSIYITIDLVKASDIIYSGHLATREA